MVLQAASDWALRRLLKVVLKKNLKHMLATELDVEQLRVSLGTGALELTDVLLSPQWLAEQAPPGLEIASAFVGRLALNVAVTSLTCALQLEDVLVTVRPSSGAPGRQAAPLAPTAHQLDVADAGAAGADGAASGLGGPGIDDGVRLVAAGVETLLQRLSVTVTRLTVRVEGQQAAAAEGGSGAPVATLSCAQISYSAVPSAPEQTAQPQHPGCPATATARRLAFGGLSLAVQQEGLPLLLPLSGEAEVTVTWPLDGLPGSAPHVSAAVSLEAGQLQLRPPDVVALLSLGRSYSAASAQARLLLEQQQQQAGAVAAVGRPAAAPAQQWQAAVEQQLAAAAGHASFLDDLMLPGFPEAAVQDALVESAASVTGQEELDEFFDSKSLLGSLQEAFSSAMSASLYASAAPGTSAMQGGTASCEYSSAASAGVGPAGGGDLGGILAMHDLAASIRETGATRRKRWSCALSVPALTLTLLYPEEAGCTSQHFAPRLVAEALDLSLRAESGEAGSSGSSGSSSDGGSTLSLVVRVVEVAEHLPFPAEPSPASSTASCAAAWAGGWVPAEEMARVPALLPAAHRIHWAAPTFAGDYPLPDEPVSGGALSSTLAQLADLSQATVYLSTTAGLEGSIMMSAASQGAAALPRVQIVPVLRCGGQEGAAMVLLCTLSGQQQPPEQLLEETGSCAAPADADMSLMLQPVSLWCTLPLLAHLQVFAEPVASQLAATQPEVPAAAVPAAVGAQHSDGGGIKAAVAAAISDILREQQPQQQPQQQAGSFRLSLYLPAACLVVAVPGCVPSDLPKYFAADVWGSSSQLLASMAPRLGSQQPKALLASLCSSGVQPTLELRQGLDGSCLWQATLQTSSFAVHAVAEAGAAPSMGESVLGPGLAAAQVASIEGSSPCGGGGLGLDVRWCQQGVAPPGSMDALWAAAAQDPDCLPEHTAVRQQLCAGATLLVTARSTAPVQLWLQHTTLGALSRLADGLLQLSAAPPPVEAATQATLLLECNLECSLVVPRGTPFVLSARSMHVAASSSVDGVAGSSVVAAAVSSLELTRTDVGAGGRRQLLVHAAGQQLADGRRRPALQLLVPLRPTGEAFVLCNNGRYVLPCQGRVCAATSALTLLLDEGGQLGWAADLQAFTPASPDATAGGSMDCALPPPPAPILDWAVCLLSAAVRYEPQDTDKAAAVLTAAAITWRRPGGVRPGSSIEARKLALHVAGPAASGGSRRSSSSGSSGRRSAAGLQQGPAWGESAAGVAGFHQVAAEAGISVQLPPPQQQSGHRGDAQCQRQDAQQQQQPAAQQAVQEIVVTNRGLTVTLSRHTLLLLRKLARQLPSSGSSKAAAPRSMSGSGLFLPDAIAGSLSDSTSGDASPMAVSVMHGVVQSAYARPQRPPEHPLEVSVFLDGGWYDPHQGGGGEGSRFVMSPAGSPPAVLDSFIEEAAGGRHGGEEEGQGTWYGGGAQVWEEYEALASPGEEEASTCFGSASFDCLALPPDHPQPLRRLSLRDISITVTLADTFTTVLLPEDPAGSSSEEEEWSMGQPGSPAAAAAGQVFGQAAGRREASEEEELVPLNAQVQARLEGLCLQLDSFADAGSSSGGSPESGCPTLKRCALAVRHLEVRDSFQPRQGGGGGAAGSSVPAAGVAAAGAAATGWADLRRLLGYHASLHRARAPKAAMLQLVGEGVCAEPGAADLEWRLQVQVLPLLVHLDQAALAFLQHFFAPAEEEGEEEEAQRSGAAPEQDQAGSEPAQPAAGPLLYIQRCEVQPFTLTLHYRPHHVDLAALTSGQLSEVLNLVPWGGISLQFRHLRLFGMPGLAGLGTAAASAYVEDIARHQAGAFVNGIAPIASICRVSAAAAQLLAIPRAALYQRASDGSGSLSLAALADQDFRRQMQRGLAGLVRAVALEACNLGATVAAGAEVALAGEASASHTAGVKKALRQASAHLRSSSTGPRTAASAAATAVRTALLGVRNTLDREHTLERRLNQ